MKTDWPALPLAQWEATYLTVHRWTQILGKLRLALATPLNHWWHATLQVTSQGLSGSSLVQDGRCISVTLDFCAHRLALHSSDGRTSGFALEAMAVAEFYERLLELLAALDIHVRIWTVPCEVVDLTPFDQDRHHASYDRIQIERLHRLLLSVDRVFNIYRSGFVGKTSPVQFFWGAFDLAVARFSGRRNPNPPADPVMADAYSHEVIAHGFWPGGDWPLGGRVDAPVFYAYAVPEPPGLREAAIAPAQARFDTVFNEFLLPYEAVRTAPDPQGTLLAFMESTYRAAAQRAEWDVEQLAWPTVVASRAL